MTRAAVVFAAAFLAAFLISGCASNEPAPANIASSQNAVETYLAGEDNNKPRPGEAEETLSAKFEPLIETEAPPQPKAEETQGPSALPIIMYHQVRNDKTGDMIISKGKLEEELAYLKKEGYASIFPQDWLAYCDGKISLPPKCVVLTFDDGWKSQYQNAVPLLEKYGFRGVFYIYPDFVCGGSAMNWQQIKDLVKRGHAVGCHSLTHAKLTRDPGENARAYAARLKKEISDSKKIIEDKIKTEVLDFCYPYGYYSLDCFALLRKAGYRSATTVNAGVNSKKCDPFTLGRFQVNQSTSLAAFASWLTEPSAEASFDYPGDGARAGVSGAECRLTLSPEMFAAWRQGGEMNIRCNHEHPQFRQEDRTLVFQAPKDDFRVTCAVKIKDRFGRTFRRSFFFTQGN